MTRMAGGALSGRLLVTPRGAHTRPTGEKVRAALGNALAAAGALDGAAVLDLYAGSGALGLELVSRGAASVVFVDNDPAALAAMRKNLAALRVRVGTVIAADATAFARTRWAPGDAVGPFDVVVADPPYGLGADVVSGLLAELLAAGRLAPGAHLVVERSARSVELRWPAPLVAVRTRRYGDTVLCYGRAP